MFTLIKDVGRIRRSLNIMNEAVTIQKANEMPTLRNVELRMKNLHLHANGVFSNVYRGILLSPGPMKEIAIKKTWPANRERNFELIFLTGINREKHKNIVQMLFAFSNRMTGKKEERMCESFVFDFMPDTLASIIKSSPLDNIDILLYSWQLFNGLKYLQSYQIVHRDIKPVNLLIRHNTGLLKIGDFGSAKMSRNGIISTAYQITRFYRPPELLLGSIYYDHTVDIWSAGCVIGEMMKRSVLLPGRDAKHQLKLIFKIFGSPSAEDLKAMKVPIRIERKESFAGIGLATISPEFQAEKVNFLNRIFVYKPKERLCGREVLQDKIFDILFKDGITRWNGQKISDIITKKDYINAIGEDDIKSRKLEMFMQNNIFQLTFHDDNKNIPKVNLGETRKLSYQPVTTTNELTVRKKESTSDSSQSNMT